MVYLRDNPIPGMGPINKSVEPQIGKLAKEIVEAIRPPSQGLVRRIFEPWVELTIDNAADLQCKDDLDPAVIVSANEQALDLFDFMEQPDTWGDLRIGIAEHAGDGRWREELFHVVRKMANGRKFDPIQAVFQSPDGKMYRPVACAIDRVGEKGRIHSYHVTFTEDVGAVDATSMPSEMSALATILRCTFRFRWEVLERFGVGTMSESDIERLENALRRIQVDWDSRGGGDAEFFPDKPVDRLAAAIERYQSIGVWGRNPLLPRAGFERLQTALVSGGLITRKVADEECIDMRFANAMIEEKPDGI